MRVVKRLIVIVAVACMIGPSVSADANPNNPLTPEQQRAW